VECGGRRVIPPPAEGDRLPTPVEGDLLPTPVDEGLGALEVANVISYIVTHILGSYYVERTVVPVSPLDQDCQLVYMLTAARQNQ